MSMALEALSVKSQLLADAMARAAAAEAALAAAARATSACPGAD